MRASLKLLVLSLVLPATAGAAVRTFTADVDLTLGVNYDSGSGSTPDNTTDVLFAPGYPTGPAIFQLGAVGGVSATNLSAQSFNSTNDNAITIGNNSSSATASNATLTLGNPIGQANAVSGAATTDLLYVAGLGNLTFQSANLRNGQGTGTGTLSMTLSQSGSFNVVNANTVVTIGTNIAGGTNSITKTGLGELQLNGTNTFSGGLNIKAGKLATTSSSLGSGTITLGDSTGTAGASLLLSGGTLNNDFVVQANNSAGTLMIAQATVAGTAGQNPILNGDIQLDNDVTLAMTRVNSDRVTTFNGQITGNKTITTMSTNNSSKPGVLLTGDNTTSFTGNVVVSTGILGFEENALGQNSTGGTISFGTSGTLGLHWVGVNTQDLSGRIQALTGTATVNLDTRDNNLTFATTNGLAGTTTNAFGKTNSTNSVVSTGTLTLAAANSFPGTYTTSTTGGATILAHSNALQNAIVSIGTGTTQTTGGIQFASSVASHTFSIGNLSGAGGVWLIDNAANAVTLVVGSKNAAATYSGVATGTGGITKVGTGTLTLSGANNFTGTTRINSGQITLNSTGRLHASAGYFVTAGTLFVDNGSTLTADRLNAVNMSLSSATYSQTGRTAASSSTTETIGNLVFDGGLNFVTLTQSTQTSSTNRLQVAGATGVIRNNRAVALVRGSNALGQQAAGTGGATFLGVTNNATADLIGGGGAFTGSTSDISIVPYLLGDDAATGQSGTTLVGYDTGNNSYRVIKTAEFLGTFTGATATSNVRLSANHSSVAVTSGTYNSLVINEASQGQPATFTADGAVILNSGVLLFSKSAGTARNILFTGGSLSGAANDVAGTSRREMIISSVTGADVQFDTQLTGAGGVTFTTITNSTPSTLTLNNAGNDYTGTTTVHGNVRVNANSKLGNSTTVNVSSGGVLTLNGNSTVNDGALVTVGNGGTLTLAFADGLLETVDQLVLGSTVFNVPAVFNLANNWGGYGNAAGSFFAGSTGGLTVVPEPASLSVVALGAAALLTRRRRRVE